MVDTKDKIAHLLRRFGLGCSQPELDSYTRLGVDGAITRLMHYEGVDEDFNVDPWSFAFVDTKDKVNLDNSRFYSWWANQMVFTNRPLKENLALFWHNHFAVSGAKIEYGPTMLGYLEVLRANANGNFRKLLSSVAHTPAMIQWLDSDSNIKGKPNENFGREVMELFTLGVGNYSETDVKEAARSFTGWSVKYSVNFPPHTTYQEQVRQNVMAERPMFCFCDCPELHDDGFKTILGKRRAYDAEMVFDLLVQQPAHPKFLMKKMWEWFVYPNPEPAVLDKVCQVYVDNNFEIKPVLMHMATCDEFWSDKCERAVVKSPVSYTIALARQMNLGKSFSTKANMEPGITDPAAGSLVNMGYFVVNIMQKQGLTLLFPPDVSGWRWGTHWITSASMMERMRIGDYFLGQGGVLVGIWTGINEKFKPQTTGDVVDALAAWFDMPLDEQTKALLVKSVDASGGMKAFAKQNTANPIIRKAFKLMSSTPGFQMC
ncbi:MAG TPA: DUF1800 domain-containing protein [Fimbriimonadaceae bacterium]|jgi:uncharacterized protein (DUF1800 family)